MSETTRISSAAAPDQKKTNPTREPATLPQWALDLIRDPFCLFSRLAWQLSFTGLENIPPAAAGGLIIAANHQTYVDPFWISIPIRRPIRYLAWSEAFEWRAIGQLMEWFGAWPLQLEKSDPAAIRRALLWLRRGGAVMIFPEGGRALPDGRMSKFKTGAARIALEANVPILPVTLCGANRAWPRGWRFPRPSKIEITYHPPHRLAPRPGEDVRHCARRETDHLAEIIRSALW